jgi:uncharacterized protein involved in type VI secretion and phage assembly
MAREYGAQYAIVTNTSDPTGKGRVMVKFPAMPGDIGGWARVCKPFGASSGAPQINAEVLVVFAYGDPNYPVVVGKLQD